MAKMRQTKLGITDKSCPPHFASLPSSIGSHEVVDTGLLAQACANFGTLISNPNTLVANAGNLIRATYFPIADVQAALDASTGAFVRVYYAVLDEGTDLKHFMFMAPADINGNAIDGANIILPCCIGENPPCKKTIGTDMYLGD